MKKQGKRTLTPKLRFPEFRGDASGWESESLGRLFVNRQEKGFSAYWYSLWSHRRNGQWKGYLQIDLLPTDDATASAELREVTGEGANQ